jgi:hypothetical protein
MVASTHPIEMKAKLVQQSPQIAKSNCALPSLDGFESPFRARHDDLLSTQWDAHSHSIVPGGFDVTSYTTRFTPFTSLMIRVATWPMNFISNG